MAGKAICGERGLDSEAKSAPAGAGRTVVFTVARAEPDLPAQALEFGGETYGCATI